MGEDFSIKAMNVNEMGYITKDGSELKLNKVVSSNKQSLVQKSSENELVGFEEDKSEYKGTLENPRIVLANREYKADSNVEEAKTESVSNEAKTEETEERGTLDNPRVVRETEEQSEAQQEKIQSLVDSLILNSNFGRKDMEVTDNVIYEDQNGNPTRQVITKENAKGEVIKIQIEYDENGRISHVSSQLDAKDDDGHTYRDGDQFNFEYLSDGTIRVTTTDAYNDQESGTTMSWLTQKPSYIIDTDGTIYMVDAMGKKSEIPFILPF